MTTPFYSKYVNCLGSSSPISGHILCEFQSFLDANKALLNAKFKRDIRHLFRNRYYDVICLDFLT